MKTKHPLRKVTFAVIALLVILGAPVLVFQYYEGHTGRLAYAETVFASPDSGK